MKSRRAFTLVEIICAVVLVGVITTLTVATYSAVTRGWEISTDYMDKMQRTDYALNQLVSALRSMYYPHEGEQSYDYGFVLVHNGDGEKPEDSDVIEFSKTGSAIVGNRSAVADTVHRVQVMILEEGNRDYAEEIEVTGLYARQCPDVALRPKNDDVDYTFANDEMYQPVLIADGVVGFNCRVLKDQDAVTANAGAPDWQDEWDASNSVPYKVELTFMMSDPEGRSYRTNTAPVMRIVRIPIFEQSQDGSATPDQGDGGPAPGGTKSSGGSSGGSRGGSRGGRGGTGGAPGGAPGGGGPRGGGGPPGGGM